MNDIIQVNGINPELWDPQTEQAIFQYLQSKQINELRNIVMQSAERMEIKIQEQDREVKNLKSMVSNFAEKQYFVQKTTTLDYNSLETIGREYNPTLNRQQMPRLLKALGILQKYAIEPMAVYQGGREPLAIKRKSFDEYGGERFNYHFNSEKLWRIVSEKLAKLNKLNRFLSLKNKKEVWKFINELEAEMGNGN